MDPCCLAVSPYEGEIRHRHTEDERRGWGDISTQPWSKGGQQAAIERYLGYSHPQSFQKEQTGDTLILNHETQVRDSGFYSLRHQCVGVWCFVRESPDGETTENYLNFI